MDISELGHSSMSEDQLNSQVKLVESDIKSMSKETIINKWFNGQLLTDAQLKHIRPRIKNPASIKSIEVRQIVLNDVGEFQGYKYVTKFFNKSIKRIDAAIVDNKLTEDLVLNANENAARNSKDLQMKMFDLCHTRGELAGYRAEKAARDETKAKTLREAKGIQKMSFDEIYAVAVKTHSLITADAVEHDLETSVSTKMTTKVEVPAAEAMILLRT